MKHIKSYTKKVLGGISALAMTVTFTSCDDFLTILPTNEIVLENFWTDEADVNSVVTSCYAQLGSSDCISRMVVWGELRSDNMTLGNNPSNDIRQILKENLLETNSYTTWTCFYQCINRCNTVLHYAPEVQAIDPNFTPSELRATMAEVTVLRALCYFYLIRAYRDVPYVTAPSIDDNIEYLVPATKFRVVLDSLIASVEAVKNDALSSYGENSTDNMTRITRWSAYALLADMYLWQGNYQACIHYCDLITEHQKAIYDREMDRDPSSVTMELYGEFPLISEVVSGSSFAGNTYNQIFGDCYSDESIFELAFGKKEEKSNSAISNFYGHSSSKGTVSAPAYLFSEAYSGNNSYFKKTDCRFLENMKEESSKVYITKYVNSTVDFRLTSTTGAMPTVSSSARSRDSFFANWIVYRYTDVLLMKAEAEVELAGEVNPTEAPTDEQLNHYRNAFSCVSAVWKRANNKRIATTDTLVFSDYSSSRTAMENLVLDERQRELMFEGKRWFDLVRTCLRDGDNLRLIQKVLPKFEENASVIRRKLASEDALFFPYNRDEIKINTELHQNPAYDISKGFEK